MLEAPEPLGGLCFKLLGEPVQRLDECCDHGLPLLSVPRCDVIEEHRLAGLGVHGEEFPTGGADAVQERLQCTGSTVAAGGTED